MKRLTLLLLGAAWQVMPASSQGLAIAPIMIDAPAGGGATSLTVSSGLAHDVTVQVRVFDWSQEGGEDQLSPARGIRFAPEIFALSPGSSQVIRMSVPDTGGQGAWRVIVDELPSAKASAPEGAAQLSIRLRYVLAMFAGKPGAPQAVQASLAGDGLHLRNEGAGWLKLHNLSLETENGEAATTGPGIVYLLPGSQISLPSPEAAGFSTLNYSVEGQAYATRLRQVR